MLIHGSNSIINNSISQKTETVKSDTAINKDMQKSENYVPNENITFNKKTSKGGNENVRENGFTHNEQETNREQEDTNTRGTTKNEQSNELAKSQQSQGLSNYQKQQQEKIGKSFKATIVEHNKQTQNEQIVTQGFKEATGLDINIFETNNNTTEAAFYSANGIYLKHNSLANKKATNFKPYHELGHWLKDNKSQQWQKLYDIIDDSITKNQLEGYINVLNDKSVFNNMTEIEKRNFIINEIVSDYIGNWANDVMNWEGYLPYLSDNYQQLLADIALENEVVGYNVFGSLEQQEAIYNEITNIMQDVLGKNNSSIINLNNTVKYSDRIDTEHGHYWQIEESKDLFKGLDDTKTLQNEAYNYILNGNSNFETIIDRIDGKDIKFARISAKEYVYGRNNRKLQGKQYQEKMRTAPSIDDLISHAETTYHSPLTHSNKLFSNGYNNYQGKVGIDNDIFRYIVRVGKTKNNENIFYDVSLELLKQKNETDNKVLRTNKNGSSLKSVSIDNSISRNTKNVKNLATVTNNKFMQNSKNNTQNSDRNLENDSIQSYTAEQQEMLKKKQQERVEIAKLIKERSFFKNVYNSNAPKEFKAELIKNRKDYNYEPVSNETTMQKANERVSIFKDLDTAKNDFLQNNLTSATDTAVGELLIKKYLENGNYKEAQEITASLAEKLTTAGQTIQAAAMFKRMTADGMLLFAQRKINQINEELNKEYFVDKVFGKKKINIKLTEEKTQFINDMMKQMEELENKKQSITNGETMEIVERQQDVIIAKIMAKLGEDIPVRTLDKLTAWRNISLLLNPKTIHRNLVSNGLFSAVENVVDVLGVPIDKAISLATGERSLLMPNLKTQAKGFKKGLDYAIYDTREGISTSLGGNKYELKPSKTFKNKWLSKLETATYFGVEGLDRPFMEAKYDSALEMIMKLEGLTYGKDIPTENMKQQALDIANYTTFKDKNAISDFLSKTKKTLNQGKSIGVADIIGITYTNIPGNLTKKAIDYSPIGLYNVFKNYNDFKTKKLNGESTRQAQRNLVQSTSRVLVGTGIMALSASAFLAGILTASGDDEDDKVKALTNQENYAINVSAFLRWITGGNTAKQNGDLYVTYSNYEPLSSIMAAAAEMTGAAKKGEDGFTVTYKGLTTWINTIAELSTLSNFSALFEYGDLGGTLTRSLSQFPSSFIPTTCKQIAQLFETDSKSNYSDNYFIKNFWNPIAQRIPGLSSTLESNYDTMGNEEKSYNGSTGLGRIYNVFLNTSYTSTVDMDNTEQELYDLYLSTGLTDHLPIEVKNYFTYKGQKITLTAQEKAKYQETLGKRTAEAFKKEMESSEYNAMTDEEKVKALSSIISNLKTEVRGEIILEPRGLVYDSTFTPATSSLSQGGYKLNLTEDMQKEYEKLANEYYTKYESQGIYSEEKLADLKSKAKDYAKNQLMQKYKSSLVKTKK